MSNIQSPGPSPDQRTAVQNYLKSCFEKRPILELPPLHYECPFCKASVNKSDRSLWKPENRTYQCTTCKKRLERHFVDLLVQEKNPERELSPIPYCKWKMREGMLIGEDEVGQPILLSRELHDHMVTLLGLHLEADFAASALRGLARIPIRRATFLKTKSDQCPSCKKGVLTFHRDSETKQLLAEDLCTLCGQRFIYLDIEDLRKKDWATKPED